MVFPRWASITDKGHKRLQVQCRCNRFCRLCVFFTVRNFDYTRYNFFCIRCNFRTNFCESHTRRENRVIRYDLSRTKFFGQIMAVNCQDNRSWPISIYHIRLVCKSNVVEAKIQSNAHAAFNNIPILESFRSIELSEGCSCCPIFCCSDDWTMINGGLLDCRRKIQTSARGR